jgi:hypothetical protein
MRHRRLDKVLSTFTERLDRSRRLAVNAYLWLGQAGAFQPPLRSDDVNSISEFAFLKAFLAWECFLEDSFVLYLLGKTPPRGRAPRRYGIPPTYETAYDLVREGSPFGKWNSMPHVIQRAERFFQDGHPYRNALANNVSKFNELNTIRNRIAHTTSSAIARFEGLVRSKIGIFPARTTVGSFLATTVPQSAPPQSFFDLYLEILRASATTIVRK